MPTPSIQTLVTDAQQVLNLDSISAVRSVVAVALANANTGTPLNPNLTTQQLWNEFYQVVNKPKSDIESIIANQLMKLLYAPPAPGGVGANGQVIFNDNGVLAGDSGLTFNPATDTLRAGLLIVPGNTQLATVGILYVGSLGSPKLKVDVAGTGETTIASATVTGDLTVDTSTLKVDSANNRVGIGTASPVVGATLQCVGTSTISGGTGASTANGLHTWFDTGTNTGYISSFHSGVDNRDLRYDAKSHVWSLAAGTAMTLNSTGLGVGGSPSYKLDVTGPVMRLINSAATADFFLTDSGTTNGNVRLRGESNAMKFITGGGVSATIDSSGNVGVGVTPSAWATSGGYKAFQVGGVGIYGRTTTSNELVLSSNCYFDTTDSRWEYITTAASTRYDQQYGAHQWFTAISGSANTLVPFVQAMTLDASGNLLVGGTSGSFRGTFVVAGGADRDILIAGVTSVSGGFQVKSNNSTSKINVIIENIPTSSAGLATGTLWNDAGTIKIA